MDWLIDLAANPFLITSVSAWFVAQVMKVLIHAIVNKQFDIYRLFGDGGMPSGHSATVTSLALMSALVYGTGSFAFAISAVLALIVCHDAMGVRRETGKQAIMINEMTKLFGVLTSEALPEVKLKEFVGHTPAQVFAGVVVGALNALVMYRILI